MEARTASINTQARTRLATRDCETRSTSITGPHSVLQQRSGTHADLDAVEGYWLRLIDANRQHLADPTNPDLLFSGQQLELPPR